MKLYDVEVQIKISNRVAALENLDDDDNDNDSGNVDISRIWKSITGSIKASVTESLGYYEMKQ